MLYSLLLVVVQPTAAPAAHLVASPDPVAQQQAAQTPASKDDPEYVKRKKAAGKDPVELWKLYEWCKEQKKEKEAKAALKDIVKADPKHKEANIALGHIFFDDKWFENQKKIDEYKKAKDLEAKQAQGLVDYKGEWVPKEDVPFLEKGLVRDELGNWVTPDIAKKIKEGWVKQDLDWVAPAEKENIDKGLWKCGAKWLPIADANAYHAEIGQWWRIPSEHFVIWTTCDRDIAVYKMKPVLEAALEDIEKVYATKLTAPLHVMVLRNHDQYNEYCAGDGGDRQQAEAQGLVNVHYACFADLALLPDNVDTLGLAYWDASTDAGNKFGPHAVRNALGLSFGERMDPSPKAAAQLAKTGNADESYIDKFYEEKRVAKWFRYGAAAYAERYYDDKTVATGGDRQWAKKWAVQNILAQGGLRPIKQILEFNLRLDQGADGAKLISEAGLLVAFCIDGTSAPVKEKFKAVQEAIKSGKDKKAVGEAFKALDAEITKNEAELRKFAGI